MVYRRAVLAFAAIVFFLASSAARGDDVDDLKPLWIRYFFRSDYVDLRHCTHMDNTFLGTLLFLKGLAERRKEGKFALLFPSLQCYQLLQQMESFLSWAWKIPVTGTWAELPSKPEDIAAFKRNVVQAHQELGRLEGPTGETFRELASGLASELASEERERQHDKNWRQPFASRVVPSTPLSFSADHLVWK
jgi:hypothetical protein